MKRQSPFFRLIIIEGKVMSDPQMTFPDSIIIHVANFSTLEWRFVKTVRILKACCNY